MAQNKVTIDVEARFVDNVSGGAQKAEEQIEDIANAAKKTQKEVNKVGKAKVKPTVDADNSRFIKKIRDAEKKARSLGKTKTAMTLSAVDKASSVMEKVASKGRNIANKVWTGTVRAKDVATDVLSRVSSLGKRIGNSAWTAIVKIKDMATTPLKKIRDSLFSIKTLIGGIVAGAAVKTAVLNPINLADAYSSAKIGFSTLLGADAGQKMMDDLDEFAKKSPFDTAGVISNAQKMLAMGWDAGSIVGDMEIIGNAAASTGNLNQGLESIVRAMAQIKTKGKLSAEELNQLAEAGIAAKGMLAEELGYGTGDAALAKFSKDQEAGNIGADVALEALLRGMKRYDGMMDSMANETAEGLLSQLKDTFQVNIIRKWGQGLQDGAKRGLGSIVGLLDKADDALATFGETVYEVGKEISNWAADKLEKAITKIQKIVGSREFKKASLGVKIKMLWDGAIANPLKKWWDETVVPWWDATVVPWLEEKARSMGKGIGSGLTGGILTLLGIDVSGALEDGKTIGGSFAEGFMQGFDGSKIWEGIKAWAKENPLLATAGGLFLGGKALSGIGGAVGNIKGLFGGGKTGGGLGGSSVATMTVNAAVVNLNGGIGAGNIDLPEGAAGAAGTGFFKKIIGSTGNYMVSGTGIAGGLAKTGYALTGGPASAGAYFGAGMSGGTAAAIGGASITGGILGAIGIGDGIVDFVGAAKAEKGSKERKDKLFQGGTKIGMVGAGAGAGAAAGAAVGAAFGGVGAVPGALIGAGIGGVGALVGGDKVGKALSDSTDEGGALSNAWKATKGFFTDTIPQAFNSAKEGISEFFTETLPEKWREFWAGVGSFFSETIPYAIGYVSGKIYTFFSETLPEFFTNFCDGVSTFFTESVPQFFSDLWNGISTFFTDTLPEWADNVWNSHIVPFFTESIPSFFAGLWTSLVAFFTETVPEWADNVWNGHIVPFFTETVPGFLSDLWNSVTGFFEDAVDFIAESIWSPIKSFFTETIPGWIGNAIAKVGDFFSGIGDSFLSGFNAGSGDRNAPGFAAGGLVRGGARLVKVAEEGSPEMIIPLGSQRRERGLMLWAKAGEMLGIDKFARGGLTMGGRGDEGSASPFHQYDTDDAVGGQSIEVDVGGVHVDIHVDARGSDNILDSIKAQSNEIAETVAGILADAFSGQFANTPARGGVA